MKTKNFKLICNTIGLSLLIFLVIRESLGSFLNAFSFEEGSIAKLVISIVLFAAACLVPVVAMENMLGLRPKLFKKVEGKAAFAAAGYSYLLIIAAGILNRFVLAVLKSIGLEFAQPALDIPASSVGFVLYFIYICILPAFLEEVLVRGYMLNALKGFGTTFAVVVSSLLFALMHSSLDNLLLYFICGVLLAQLYLAFDSLLPAMLLHFINNSISFFMQVFQQRVNAISALSLTVYLYVLVLIFGYIGKRYIDKKGIHLRSCYAKDSLLLQRLVRAGKSYVLLCAVLLLVFFASLGSYNRLV